MERIIITENNSGQRVDKFIAEEFQISRGRVQNLLKEEKILINNESVKNKYLLLVGDEIEILEMEEEKKEIDIIAEDITLDIVYEDEYLIVINKESGMVVHPAPGNPDGTLVNALMYYSDRLSDVNGEFRPGIVHRLDKNTSGLIIVAKTNEVHNLLADMIKKREISRQYKALVHGTIKEKSAIIKAPIGRDPKDRKKMTVTDQNAKYAETELEVIERNLEYTFIKLKLATGRTHQIRVHSKYIKHPVVGDPEYGPRNSIDVQGQALHAYKLEFTHPITGKEMKIISPLPSYYQDALKEAGLEPDSIEVEIKKLKEDPEATTIVAGGENE